MEVARKKIVVLGAGFAGLTFCQEFAHPDADVVLIDRQNHHLFQPLLYQVATAGLSATDIAQPIRGILSDYPQVTVLMDEVRGIDLNLRRVELGRQTLDYDYLVMALGGVTSYFGHPEWEPFAPGLKSLDDALKIRRSILFAFERAEMSTSVEERKRLTTIVVVGGGPTGVELSGAFAELARTVLNKDFRHIDPAQARVVLIEASPRVLAHFPEDLSRNAREQLEKLGVEVHTGVKVLDVKQGVVETSIGPIDAENVIWGAGVGANPLGKQLGAELDRALYRVCSLDGMARGAFTVSCRISQQDCRFDPMGLLVFYLQARLSNHHWAYAAKASGEGVVGGEVYLVLRMRPPEPASGLS